MWIKLAIHPAFFDTLWVFVKTSRLLFKLPPFYIPAHREADIMFFFVLFFGGGTILYILNISISDILLSSKVAEV